MIEQTYLTRFADSAAEPEEQSVIAAVPAYNLNRSMPKSCARRVTPLSERVAGMISIGLCLCVFWGLAIQATRIQQLNDEITQLQNRIDTVQNINDSIASNVAVLENPLRVLSIAKHLHMRPAAPIVIHKS